MNSVGRPLQTGFIAVLLYVYVWLCFHGFVCGKVLYMNVRILAASHHRHRRRERCLFIKSYFSYFTHRCHAVLALLQRTDNVLKHA